ncbi:hypothetical protein [Lysobacter sp. Hz 25]|uniref:hypothetical protein n=1 Tax=Lysobacter sp. Hz 25 TaxID=3383698 RepID=UPI0038D4982F
MSTRIYAVTDKHAEPDADGTPAAPSLVRASTKAQAVTAVVRDRYSASVASQEQLVAALAKGVKVITAGEEDGEDSAE